MYLHTLYVSTYLHYTLFSLILKMYDMIHNYICILPTIFSYHFDTQKAVQQQMKYVDRSSVASISKRRTQNPENRAWFRKSRWPRVCVRLTTLRTVYRCLQANLLNLSTRGISADEKFSDSLDSPLQPQTNLLLWIEGRQSPSPYSMVAFTEHRAIFPALSEAFRGNRKKCGQSRRFVRKLATLIVNTQMQRHAEVYDV